MPDRIKRYLGPVQLHFIKDSWGVRGEGSLSSFLHLLLSEVNALARAHVAALGGNALLGCSLVPQEAGGRVSRNQGFTMFSITGDAVLLEFHLDPMRAESAAMMGMGIGLSTSNSVLNLTPGVAVGEGGIPTVLPLRHTQSA
jgi:hypothetical protein